MATGDMIQVHMLTAYPAALLNRDDRGLAKRVTFGGSVRTRVSSQCLKKHWRDSGEVGDLGDQAHRSTLIFERKVAEPLVDEGFASSEEALAAARYLMSTTVDTEPVKGGDGEDTARSKQLLVLTKAETDFLGTKAREALAAVREAGGDPTDLEAYKKHFKVDRTLRKQLETLAASVDTALFGRMVTSDLFSRVDAAVSVAHAFTTHEEEPETDYFTAVDTLKGAADDAGAALIQDTELTSGVYYLYAVIDMNQLRDNLGNAVAPAEAGRALVRAMATVSPGAKRGSTAPYAYAEFMLLERSGRQPRTLANAFLDPVGRSNGRNVMEGSVDRLLDYRHRLATMYGSDDGRAALSTVHRVDSDTVGPPVSFEDALTEIFREER